ncbi:unnamed protein product [Prorocentrum cordatum]|uniref:Uncharacterized protein n=1 Tax=Prorocentrum cordatum TaxID=2364126 RepID=A0ABN9QD00_9DINO|nr:unnamed protein product [Polarella glacialis]
MAILCGHGGPASNMCWDFQAWVVEVLCLSGMGCPESSGTGWAFDGLLAAVVCRWRTWHARCWCPVLGLLADARGGVPLVAGMGGPISFKHVLGLPQRAR